MSLSVSSATTFDQRALEKRPQGFTALRDVVQLVSTDSLFTSREVLSEPQDP
jgi:hypothetical protein